MNRSAFHVAVWILLVSGAVHAQATAGAVDPRSQLEMRKQEQAAQFDAQEQACAKVFAVTDCINAVNARRRVVVAALRKEENALNEVERRQRERERLESLQEKARQRALQEPPVDASGETAEDRLQRQQDKLVQHTPQAAARVSAGSEKPAAMDPQSREKNVAEYAARQKAAGVRRAARDKKLKEQAQPTGDLPTPP